MKSLLFGSLLVLLATSCGKWDDGNKKVRNLTYYSEDFKDADLTILAIPTSEIDALWVEFKQDENKVYSTYTLNVKSHCEVTKESGSCSIDWKDQITFTPNGGKSYIGKWVTEKDTYSISFDGKTRTEELTFNYKEHHCGH